MVYSFKLKLQVISPCIVLSGWRGGGDRSCLWPPSLAPGPQSVPASLSNASIVSGAQNVNAAIIYSCLSRLPLPPILLCALSMYRWSTVVSADRKLLKLLLPSFFPKLLIVTGQSCILRKYSWKGNKKTRFGTRQH